VIESVKLSKLYNRGVYALRDLSITIDKGEFLFLTGPSGAGKSTFLKLLLREDLPSNGELTVMGRDLRTLKPAQIQSYRRGVGFVFQDFRLVSRFTVFENVAFVMRVLGLPLATQQRKTFQVLKWVGLQHRMNAYPEELSGGEQQRIAIARALVNDPQLVLADEPTGNLDPDLSLEIMNLFREVNARGTTCHRRNARSRVDSPRWPALRDARPRTDCRDDLDAGDPLLVRGSCPQPVARPSSRGCCRRRRSRSRYSCSAHSCWSRPISNGSARNGAVPRNCRSISKTMRPHKIARQLSRYWRQETSSHHTSSSRKWMR
jgi:cell division transport system ATP-binding protein